MSSAVRRRRTPVATAILSTKGWLFEGGDVWPCFAYDYVSLSLSIDDGWYTLRILSLHRERERASCRYTGRKCGAAGYRRLNGNYPQKT